MFCRRDKKKVSCFSGWFAFGCFAVDSKTATLTLSFSYHKPCHLLKILFRKTSYWNVKLFLALVVYWLASFLVFLEKCRLVMVLIGNNCQLDDKICHPRWLVDSHGAKVFPKNLH